MKRLFIFLFAALIAAHPLRAVAVDLEAIVTLRPESEVNSDSIRLSDVFSGVPEEIDRQIAAAPAPGKSVFYDARVLTGLAVRYKLNWRPQSSADRAVITRAAAYITREMIEKAAREQLEKQNVKGKIEIQFDGRNHFLALPADRAPAFELRKFEYDPQNKRFRAELVAETSKAPIIIPLSGKISVKREVPVLVRRLEAGTTISKADIGRLEVAEDRLANGAITDEEQLIGRELRQSVPENQIIYSRDITMPRLVARGALVTMKIQTPNMTITAQGKALQDGAFGEVVRVANTQSNRVVEGTVSGPGVIQIHTVQKIASAR